MKKIKMLKKIVRIAKDKKAPLAAGGHYQGGGDW